MAIWPFKRKKQHSIDHFAPESKGFYENDHREHMGIAWLIALLSLCVTILVLTGLYFGGRWVYRKVANKPTDKPTTSQEETEPQASDDSDQTNNKPQNNGSNQNSASTNGSQNPSQVTTPAAPADSNLPNTGPESDE